MAGENSYIFWHKNANDGTCADCAYDYVTNKITMEAGHHSFEATGVGTASCHCGDSTVGVVAIVDGNAYTSLTDAFAKNSAVTLIGHTQEDVTITADGVLDLNGYNVDGNITVVEGVIFFLKDSQTDDYTVADDNYGRITGTITGATPANGYVQIVEADGASYHKIDIRVKSVSLRASSVGIYYTAEYLHDEVVERNLSAKGVTLSTQNTAPVADGSDESSLYTLCGNSVLLSGIMDADETTNNNKMNARQQIYSRAYLLLNDGSYLYSETVSTTFRDVVETIDATHWDSLTDGQKAALAELYSTYKTAMDSWQIERLKNYQA